MCERMNQKEGRMTWIFRREAKLTWQCLEECKNSFSASSFNLYYKYTQRDMKCIQGLLEMVKKDKLEMDPKLKYT